MNRAGSTGVACPGTSGAGLPPIRTGGCAANGHRGLAVGIAMALSLAVAVRGPAAAADLQFTLPTVTAPPGATVVVPIESSTPPDGLGILAIEFRMDFTPGVISGSASWADGWMPYWGAPFVNGNASFIAVANAGFPAIASAGTRVNTLELTVSPSATPGTDMPLTLQHVLCNEGSPSVAVTPGLLRVRSTAGVGDLGAVFALSPPVPNPVANAARLTLMVPAGEGPPVSVAVFGLDGRRIRGLAHRPLGAGTHEFSWDLRDDSGSRVRAGLYFVRAARGGEHLVRRLAVTR